MSALKTLYSAAIEVAIAKAKAIRDLGTVETFDGAECYATLKVRAASPGASTRPELARISCEAFAGRTAPTKP
jgi:hypothetical protein